ncbi:MAG: hypothetical protein IJX55_02625 [Clostridia bacterium]|nr:hypothetical protein [Clostridia bacterium]
MSKNTSAKAKNKKLLIAIISIVLVVALAVPIIIVAVSSSEKPIDFLRKNDLSEFVDVSVPEKFNYGELRETLVAGYDLFRVGITETYFGTNVYVEEGSTLDFTLSAELITTKEDGTKEYTKIELPEKYAKIEGYRPYSKEENLFFDKALAEVGDKDDYGVDFMVRDTESKFAMDIPNEERFGEYAGTKIRFTITVTDYVARYVYLYGGNDNSISIVGDWYCKIATGKTQPTAGATIEEGDVIVYDVIDTLADGTKNEYRDYVMEVTSEYVSYFEGKKQGESFTETVQDITEEFTIKEVYKSEDIEAAFKTLGYESAFDMKEELRIWCYSVYSDGLMAIITKQVELKSYPKNLVNTYTKLEEQTWEVDFRESALSMAQTWGDDVAFQAYEITGYETMADYLDDMVADHVETLVRELVISYSVAKELGVMDDLYTRYNDSIDSYIEQNNYSSRKEALATLADNGDEACIFYTNFLSPILGTKFAERMEGAEFLAFIADSYVA